jgi:hypothetical protein
MHVSRTARGEKKVVSFEKRIGVAPPVLPLAD